MYGVAATDFIAITQFITAQQFQMKWSSGIAAQFGILGMMVMIITVPMCTAYGIYCEMSNVTGDAPKHNTYLAGAISSFGIGGLGLTLASFRPLFGFVFLGSNILSAGVIAALLPKRMRSN
jgi:hypothetical protein